MYVTSPLLFMAENIGPDEVDIEALAADVLGNANSHKNEAAVAKVSGTAQQAVTRVVGSAPSDINSNNSTILTPEAAAKMPIDELAVLAHGAIGIGTAEGWKSRALAWAAAVGNERRAHFALYQILRYGKRMQALYKDESNREKNRHFFDFIDFVAKRGAYAARSEDVK